MTIENALAATPVTQSSYVDPSPVQDPSAGARPFVRRDLATSSPSAMPDGNANSGQSVAIDVDSQVPIPGLLGSMQVMPQGPGTPGAFIPDLADLYRSMSFDTTKNPQDWSNLLSTRSEFLHRYGYSLPELEATSQFMQAADNKTNWYVGMATGGLPFGAAGVLVGELMGPKVTQEFGPYVGPLLVGATVAVGERVFSGMTKNIESLDLRYAKVPRPGQMLHPAVANQYADVQPTDGETVKAANLGFGNGYTAANVARTLIEPAFVAGGVNPLGIDFIDSALGVVIGGGVTGATMNGSTLSHGLGMTLARTDFEQQMAAVRRAMAQGPVESFVDGCGAAARHGTEAVTGVVSSFIPPKVAGYMFGDEYGPSPDASFYTQYAPKIVQSVLRPSTLTNMAVLAPYALATSALGDKFKGFVPDASAPVKQMLENVGNTIGALPFFYLGGSLLVWPELKERELLKYFDCSSGEPDAAEPARDADIWWDASSEPHSSIQMEPLQELSASNLGSGMPSGSLGAIQGSLGNTTAPTNPLLLPV